MTVMMTDSRVIAMKELAAFLESSVALSFRGEMRREIYAWVEKTLGEWWSLPYESVTETLGGRMGRLRRGSPPASSRRT